jgi:hypothetical protein
MKIVFAMAMLTTFTQCDGKENIKCDKRFYDCARVCASICERTVNKAYEFGKCFSICSAPCRREYCEEVK